MAGIPSSGLLYNNQLRTIMPVNWCSQIFYSSSTFSAKHLPFVCLFSSGPATSCREMAREAC